MSAFVRQIPALALGLAFLLSGCAGGTHETYEAPTASGGAPFASITGEQYGDQGYKYMDISIGETNACLTRIDDKRLVSGDDCRGFTSHTYRAAAGQHTVQAFYWINIGNAMFGQHLAPKGWGADIPVQMEAGKSYVLHAKRSGISRVSLWVTSSDGAAASPVVDRYVDMVGQLVFSSGGEQRAPQKHKIFVYMDSSANYGSNDARFRDEFSAMAARCNVKTEFYAAPHRGGGLDLNDKAPDLTEVRANIAKFGPDGILTLKATKQSWFGNAGSGSDAPTWGTFYFNAVLTTPTGGPVEWNASVWHSASGGGGGEHFADGIVGRFSELGIFPNCPDLNIQW